MARRKKKKVNPRGPPKAARLNLLMDSELKEWAHCYAGRKRTSITAIVVRHFVALKELDESGDVEQI